ncbi:hypothetical protein [Streptococcus parasuis]|uniref:hypothetical protein n=1 Tax=Streptococcus parasuis TaxID=1501662 RepID=UPI00289CA0EB|nr:hypothetical protein [Streptococcus parasuis]
MKKYLKKIGFIVLMLSVLNSFVIPHTASADEVSSTSDENIIIYDKNGEVVEPSREIIENNDMIIQPLGVNYPTTVKWLNNGASYQSNEFYGSGRRYGGYFFGSSTTSTFRLTFQKGGFGVNTTSSAANPSNVVEAYNLPLSGSPYTIITSQFFYFLVDNPKSGQTYHVKAVQ